MLTHILLTSCAVLCGVLLTNQVRLSRRLKWLESASESGRGQVANIEQGLRGLCSGARRMGDELAGVEQKLRRITERQDNLDLREPDVATYRHAIEMAQQGADVTRLMKSCGLARGEAELVRLMHQQQAAGQVADRRRRA